MKTVKTGYIIATVNGIYWTSYEGYNEGKKCRQNAMTRYYVFDTEQEAIDELPNAFKELENLDLVIHKIYYNADSEV